MCTRGVDIRRAPDELARTKVSSTIATALQYNRLLPYAYELCYTHIHFEGGGGVIILCDGSEAALDVYVYIMCYHESIYIYVYYV